MICSYEVMQQMCKQRIYNRERHRKYTVFKYRKTRTIKKKSDFHFFLSYLPAPRKLFPSCYLPIISILITRRSFYRQIPIRRANIYKTQIVQQCWSRWHLCFNSFFSIRLYNEIKQGGQLHICDTEILRNTVWVLVFKGITVLFNTGARSGGGDLFGNRSESIFKCIQ